MKLIEKIKNSLRKKFRIVKNDLACPDKTIPDMVLSIYEANLQKIQERNENVIF
jgi:hypothetical protein